METKTEIVRARITPEVKHAAEAIFATLGLGHTEAIRLFYQQVILNRGLPFGIRIPNKETQKTIDNIRKGKNLHKTTLKQLRDEFGA